MRFFFKIHLFSRDFFWWFICFHMIHFDMWWLHDSFILTWFFFKIHFILMWFFFKIHFVLMWFSFKIHLFSPDFNMQFLYSQLIYFHVIFFSHTDHLSYMIDRLWCNFFSHVINIFTWFLKWFIYFPHDSFSPFIYLKCFICFSHDSLFYWIN